LSKLLDQLRKAGSAPPKRSALFDALQRADAERARQRGEADREIEAAAARAIDTARERAEAEESAAREADARGDAERSLAPAPSRRTSVLKPLLVAIAALLVAWLLLGRDSPPTKPQGMKLDYQLRSK